MSEEEWMRLTEVAAESNLTPDTVCFLIQTNMGPMFYRRGRNRRVKRDDFDEWFESDRVKYGENCFTETEPPLKQNP